MDNDFPPQNQAFLVNLNIFEKKEKSDSWDYSTVRARLSKFLSKKSTNHYQSENKFVPYSLQNHHSL